MDPLDGTSLTAAGRNGAISVRHRDSYLQQRRDQLLRLLPYVAGYSHRQ